MRLAIEMGDVLAIHLDRSAGRLQQFQQRAAGGGLAAAAFAHQAQGFAGIDVKRNAVDGVDKAGGARKHALVHREILLADPALPATGSCVGSEHGFRVPAGDPMFGPVHFQRWIGRAALVRREAATGRARPFSGFYGNLG